MCPGSVSVMAALVTVVVFALVILGDYCMDVGAGGSRGQNRRACCFLVPAGMSLVGPICTWDGVTRGLAFGGSQRSVPH